MTASFGGSPLSSDLPSRSPASLFPLLQLVTRASAATLAAFGATAGSLGAISSAVLPRPQPTASVASGAANDSSSASFAIVAAGATDDATKRATTVQ